MDGGGDTHMHVHSNDWTYGYLHVLHFWLDIRGAFHDNFPGFLGFGFRRKLVRMKTQQGTDKASEHNGRKVFSRALVSL